jgi:hypothetical protein
MKKILFFAILSLTFKNSFLLSDKNSDSGLKSLPEKHSVGSVIEGEEDIIEKFQSLCQDVQSSLGVDLINDFGALFCQEFMAKYKESGIDVDQYIILDKTILAIFYSPLVLVRFPMELSRRSLSVDEAVLKNFDLTVKLSLKFANQCVYQILRSYSYAKKVGNREESRKILSDAFERLEYIIAEVLSAIKVY